MTEDERGTAMPKNEAFEFYLVRHGAQEDDHLTPGGVGAVTIAGHKLQRLCRTGALMFVSPASRAQESGQIIGKIVWQLFHLYNEPRLLPGTFHQRKLHRSFAAEIVQLARVAAIDFPFTALRVVLVGHDENRPHLSAMVRAVYGKKVPPPPKPVPLGGILVFRDPVKGYEFL